MTRCNHDHHGLTGSSWDEERAAYLAEGRVVRCAALRCRNGLIHVLFTKRDEDSPVLGYSGSFTCDDCVGYYMAESTYGSFPLLAIVTFEQFEEVGPCVPAPNYFNREDIRALEIANGTESI